MTLEHLGWLQTGSSIALCFLFSFYTFGIFKVLTAKIGDNGQWLLVFMLLSFLIRLIVGSEADLTDWDEQYHALVAKNLITDPFHPKLFPFAFEQLNQYDWTLCHTWLHKPPLPLWLMAVSMKIFGVSCLALRIPSILIGTLSIWFTTSLTEALFKERKPALLSGALVGIHGLFIEMNAGKATTDHVDTLFIFSVLLFFWSAIKFKNNHKKMIIHLALALIIGFLSKGLIALSGPIILLVSSLLSQPLTRKELGLHLLSISIALIPYILWQLHTQNLDADLSQFEAKEIINHLFVPIEGHAGSYWFYFEHMRIMFGELIYLVLIMAGIILIRRRDEKISVILIWILGPLVFFTMSATKMQSYLMLSMPAYAIISAYICLHFLEKGKWWFKVLGVIVILTWVRYGVERSKPFQSETRWCGVEQMIRKKYENLPEKSIVMGCPDAVTYSFYSSPIFVPKLLLKREIEEFRKQDFKLFEWHIHEEITPITE